MDDKNVIFDKTNDSGGEGLENPQSENISSQEEALPSQNNTTAETVPSQELTPGDEQFAPESSPVTTQDSVGEGAQSAPVLQEGGSEAPPAPPPPKIGGGLWKKIAIGAVLLILIVFAVFLFVSRGSSDDSAELVWWGLWEDAGVVAPIIEDFQREHPNIKVEYVKQDPKQYREKLQTRIQNGTGPDIFRYHNTWVPMLASELLPLSTDVISPDEFKKTYYPVMQNDLMRNGAIYGIPLGADTLILFVNTELLDAAGVSPPQTWEEFVSAARALTVKEEGRINTAGAALGTVNNVTHAPDIISLLFIQQGIDIRDFPNAEKSDKVDAINFYTSFAKGSQNVWDSTLDESIMLFASERLAMYIGFSWDIFRINSLNPEFSFETHPVPQLVGRDAGLASYWVEGVSAKSKNQSASLTFLQFLAKKETAEKFYTEASKTREFGELYARVDMAPALEENEILKPFITELDNAQSSFFASDTYDGEGGINSLLNVYLGNAVNSIINDNSSAESVVETLDQGVLQVFEKYGVK
jgi:ABC-type glycerol-3-phosphate transport system substrate-binding protein